MRTLTTLAAAAFALTLAPAAGAFQFTTIDHPDAAGVTFTLGINDQGDIAGAYLGDDGGFHGFVLFDDTYEEIAVPGATQTICGSIGHDRRVTGTYYDAEGSQHGFLWKAGAFATIDAPDAVQSPYIPSDFGYGVGTAAARTNARGLTIGTYGDAIGALHGYSLYRGTFTTLDFPGGAHAPGFGTTLIALDDKGRIGGSYVTFTAPHFHGMLYAGGQWTTLDAPGAGGNFGTQINGMNDTGVLVGPYSDAEGFYHGFLWREGQFETVDVPGALFTEVDSINNGGQFVGEWLGPDGVLHGYVGTR